MPADAVRDTMNTLIFDIGKTNKKCFVFDQNGQILHETSTTFPETTDDDGFPCDDVHLLTKWVLETTAALRADGRFTIERINCTAYGASFVHLGADGKPVAPLYNYLKPFPEALLAGFMEKYGPASDIARQTASPILGHLNSGLQLYWLRHHKPDFFQKIKYSLHLPQYIAYLLTGQMASEMTSIGCHTLLWDFERSDYHHWVYAEGIDQKFPPIAPSNDVVGLHDSSSALLPYIYDAPGPFLLLSTGTWWIALHPFNTEPLTATELEQDCLCYLTPTGAPVKAARYFGGHFHDEGMERLAHAYGLPLSDFLKIAMSDTTPHALAYISMVKTLVDQVAHSIRLALGGTGIQHMNVDGGFAKNTVFMALLQRAFPTMTITTAEVPQATAIGALKMANG
jgi:sugar (pentulose or hexulose) kinase